MPWSTLRGAKKNAGTGFHYYRARYYHPTLQRFVAEDPLEFLPE